VSFLLVRLSQLSTFSRQIADHLAHRKKYRVLRLSCSMRRWRQRDIPLHPGIEAGYSKSSIGALSNHVHLPNETRNGFLGHFLDS
jgi:hypothetical protein